MSLNEPHIDGTNVHGIYCYGILWYVASVTHTPSIYFVQLCAIYSRGRMEIFQCDLVLATVTVYTALAESSSMESALNSSATFLFSSNVTVRHSEKREQTS